MGEIGKFCHDDCEACEGEVPRLLAWKLNFTYCVRCYADLQRRLVLDRIDFGRQVDLTFRQDLAMYLVYDSQRLERLWFLRMVLLARGSPFKKFLKVHYYRVILFEHLMMFV